MGASTSSNKQIFNIYGNNNTLSSVPKISSSVTVPMELSNGVNPVYYENLDDLSILADLNTAQFLAAVEGIDFETMIPTIEEIESDDALNEQLRLFGITPSTFQGVFKGFSSINVNTITSFTKSLSNVLNVVNNSIGSETTLKGLATKLAPVAGKFLKGIWDKKVGSTNDDSVKISSANIPVSDTNTLNSQTDNLNPQIITLPRLITINTANNNILHDVTIGSKGPEIFTDNTGAPISKTDALLSNKMLVPFADTVNALTQTAACSTVAENMEVNSACILSAATGSSPNIMITPPNAALLEAFELVPKESKPLVKQTINLAGAMYGLSIDSSSKAGPSNTLQNLVDSVTIPGKQGMTLRNVNSSKRKYVNSFENYDTELLIASPSQINTSDMLPVNHIVNHPWLEVFTPYLSQRKDLNYTRLFVDSASFSSNLPSTAFSSDISSADPSFGPKVNALLLSDYNYKIDDIYNDYDISVNFSVSYFTNVPDITGNSVHKFLKPGIFAMAKDGPMVFIPFRPNDKSFSTFRGSINTRTLNKDVNIFSGTGFFTFGLAVLPTYQVQVLADKAKLVTLKINEASVHLVRSSSSIYINQWVYDREFTNQPILTFVNSIHPGVLESQSPLDVNVVWSTITSKYLPYLSIVASTLETKEYDIVVASVARLLSDALDEKHPLLTNGTYDFKKFSHVRKYIINAMYSLPSWLYYSIYNPFDLILPTHKMIMAWKLLSIARSIVPVAIYNSSSSGTILSAWKTIGALTGYSNPDPEDLNNLSMPITRSLESESDFTPLSLITRECFQSKRAWEM